MIYLRIVDALHEIERGLIGSLGQRSFSQRGAKHR